MFGERWHSIVSERADAVALHIDGRQCTFAELETRARGLTPTNGIFIAKGNALDVAAGFIAAALSGLPVQVVERDRDQRLPACALPHATQVIKQTVGGAGVRRCQFFTAAQVLADVDRLHHALELDHCACAVAAISPAHSYGLTVTVLQMLFHGLPLHVVNEPFPDLIAEAVRQHDHVFLPGIPALWKAWLQSRHMSWSRVERAVSAGSPLTTALELAAFEPHGLKLHNLYGTSETGSVAYDTTPIPRMQSEVLGTLLPGVGLTVGASNRAIVSSDAVGLGYDFLLEGEIFGGCRFQTSDHLSIGGDSMVRWHAHLGTGINVAGRKLSPGEIAAKLERATGLQPVTVHGQPSRDLERCQEVVALFPLPQSALTPAFRSQACAFLSPWEMPRRWVGTGSNSLPDLHGMVASQGLEP